MADANLCPICLVNLSGPAYVRPGLHRRDVKGEWRLPCGHVFHARCLLQQVTLHGGDCSVCGSPFVRFRFRPGDDAVDAAPRPPPPPRRPGPSMLFRCMVAFLVSFFAFNAMRRQWVPPAAPPAPRASRVRMSLPCARPLNDSDPAPVAACAMRVRPDATLHAFAVRRGLCEVDVTFEVSA